MDLIYMNASMEDIGVIRAYEFDLAYGSDENDFELKGSHLRPGQIQVIMTALLSAKPICCTT